MLVWATPASSTDRLFFLSDAEIPEEEVVRLGMDKHEFHVIMNAEKGEFVLFVRLQQTRWRTYFCSSNLDRSQMSEEFLRSKWQSLFPPPGPPLNAQLLDAGYFSVDCRLVEAYRKGRVLLAGDAAHCHSPAGGQGMNTGLQDAANLGWKLAAVIKGHAPETLLDSYEPERRPVAQWVLSTSDEMFKNVSDQSSATVNAVRRFLLRSLTACVDKKKIPPAFFLNRMTGLSISYEHAGTCRNTGQAPPRGAILAGQRMPDLMYKASDGSSCYTMSLLQDLSRMGGFLVMLVCCMYPSQSEVSAALEPFRKLLTAGLCIRPCLFVGPAPCCLEGCFSWVAPKTTTTVGPTLVVPDGLADLVHLTPTTTMGPSLPARLRLHSGGKAVLVVRPDGYITVVQRGSWSGQDVMKTLADLSCIT